MNRFYAGLKIFIERWGEDWYISAEHDQVWIGAYSEDKVGLITGTDTEKLRELGWFINETWSHYV